MGGLDDRGAIPEGEECIGDGHDRERLPIAVHLERDRLPATCRRTHCVTYFYGCYFVDDDRLWGVNHRRTGTANSLAALKPIRAARLDSVPIYSAWTISPLTPAWTSTAGRRRTGPVASCGLTACADRRVTCDATHSTRRWSTDTAYSSRAIRVRPRRRGIRPSSPGGLPSAEDGRALHQQAQATAWPGHPLRQDRHDLPRWTPPRRHLHLVSELIRKKRPAQPDSVTEDHTPSHCSAP